jgi:hypothetical protein
VLYSIDTQQLDRCVCATTAQQPSSRRVSWWHLPFTPTTKSVIIFRLFRSSSVLLYPFWLQNMPSESSKRPVRACNSYAILPHSLAKASATQCMQDPMPPTEMAMPSSVLASRLVDHNSCRAAIRKCMHASGVNVTSGHCDLLWYDHAVHIRSSENFEANLEETARSFLKAWTRKRGGWLAVYISLTKRLGIQAIKDNVEMTECLEHTCTPED